MTVDELWEEATSSLGKSTPPHRRLREALAELVVAAHGPARIMRGLDQKLHGKMLLLRQLAMVLDPSGPSSSKLSEKDRRDLLEQATRIAQCDWKADASYWMFLWLRLMNGDGGVARVAARDLKNLINEGGYRPEDAIARFKRLRGWGDYSQHQWTELVEEAQDADDSAEFRARLQPLLNSFRSGGEKLPLQAATPVGNPVQGNPPRSGELTTVGDATNATPSAKPAQGGPQRVSESVTQAGIPVASTPVQDIPRQSSVLAKGTHPAALKALSSNPQRTPEPTSAAATTTVPVTKPGQGAPPGAGEPIVPVGTSVGKPVPEKLPQAPAPPVSVVATPTPDREPAGAVPPAQDAAPPAPAEVRQEGSEAKESRPKRVAAKKTPSKDAAVASPPSDSANANVPAAAGTSVRANAPEAAGEIPAVLTELVSAVRAISGRLDQLASRGGDGVSFEQRLVELERRLSGVERALTDTQSDAQRSSDEAERFRARVRGLEQDLEDAIRERDAAATRADDLARRLASADARITVAESRADQNIHEAFRERDEAVLTFKARLWDAVQAQLSDVTDPTPGEEFASTEEEVLTTRLRSIRDTLRNEGVPP